MSETKKPWNYQADAQVRDLARGLPVVQEAVELLQWILLLADQEFLQPPPGLRPGVWDDYLSRSAE
jgi:hypothetical protein